MDQTMQSGERRLDVTPNRDSAGRVGPQQPSQFPTPEARALVRDLVETRIAIYWIDFLFHITLGWTAFALALAFEPFSPFQIVYAVVAAFALYRSVIFIHELAHRREKRFELFRWAWNLLCGFPLLTPSFTYSGVHTDHHSKNIYGRKEDGEYLDFALLGRGAIFRYPLLSVLLPVVLIARFLVLAPLSLCSSRLADLVWERCSSLTIDMGYQRRPGSARERRYRSRYEAITFVYAATAIGLVIAGVLPLAFLGLWYAMAAMIFTVNSLRTLAAHRYRNPDGQTLGLKEQFLDSVDVPGHRFWTAFWAPVGLRYHATHHLFPSIPYHALGEAHRRLTTQLSDSAVYRSATRKSLYDALRRLWNDAAPSSMQSEAVTEFS
jgi:fatty acid desaturase